MVQDRDMVTVEDKHEIMYGLSNGMIDNDLEWGEGHFCSFVILINQEM